MKNVIEKTDKLYKELEKASKELKKSKDSKKISEYKKEFEKIISKSNIIKKIGDQFVKFDAKFAEPHAPENHHPIETFVNDFKKINDNLQKIIKFLKNEKDIAKDIDSLGTILQNVNDVAVVETNKDQIKKLITEVKDFIAKADDEQKEFLAPVWQDKILNLGNIKTVRTVIEDPNITQLKNDLQDITTKLGLTLPELVAAP